LRIRIRIQQKNLNADPDTGSWLTAVNKGKDNILNLFSISRKCVYTIKFSVDNFYFVFHETNFVLYLYFKNISWKKILPIKFLQILNVL
jgi:hypothetical protein